MPFIVTLGTYTIYRGLAKWLASNTTVYIPAHSKPWWFGSILKVEPEPHWLLVAPGVWMVLALSAVVALVLRYSLLGRYAYAIGSNESTARVCGINVPAIKIIVYAIGGLATGLAAVLEFAYLSATGDPTCASGLELQVIAAVVIGGGSLSGGEGTVLGTLIGCLIMTVLANGCVHADISDSSRDIFIGIIIIAAVTLDRLQAPKRGLNLPERNGTNCAQKLQLTLFRDRTTMPPHLRQRSESRKETETGRTGRPKHQEGQVFPVPTLKTRKDSSRQCAGSAEHEGRVDCASAGQCKDH